MLSYRTAGESHGKGILALLEGVPAGLRLSVERIDAALERRQGGYGRGARQEIEQDRAQILSGVRRGISIGSPLAIWIANRDDRIDAIEPKSVPRPGHADLAGMIKFGTLDLHNVAERASARETCGRVAAGALAQELLRHFGIEVVGFVTRVGPMEAAPPSVAVAGASACRRLRDASRFYTLRPRLDAGLAALVDRAKRRGDTLGGGVEARAFGVPAGLGSHAQWDERLDGLLARAAMAIQAVKAVEIGDGRALAGRFGSGSHDAIRVRGKKILRPTNRSGGIEGGITNGSTVVVRSAMKPLSTLMRPLASADLGTGQSARATVIRSDICAVSACSVVLEAVVAFEIARAFLAKFRGDSLPDVADAFRRSGRRNRKIFRKLQVPA